METVTITLARPLRHGEKTISELTFREPEVGDMMAADAVKGEFSRVVAVLAQCCGLPLPVFKRISGRDMAAILEKTASLTGNEFASSDAGDPDTPESPAGDA